MMDENDKALAGVLPRDPEDGTVVVREGPEPAWQRHGVISLRDMLQHVYEDAKRKDKPPSVSMCYSVLDVAIGGFRPRMITVLGAATSFGKSTYAIMVADEAIREGKRVLFVSTEDDDTTYGQRIAARRARVNAVRLRERLLDTDSMVALEAEAKRAQDVPWFLYAVGSPVEKTAAAIKELCDAEGYDLVIVDYLQAITCERKLDRRNEVTWVTRCLTDAIKGGGAAGLLLSQIRRLEPGAKPNMHALKESGDVENMAESILIGHVKDGDNDRTGVSEKKHWLTIAKNKGGPIGIDDIFMPFDTHSAMFFRQTEAGDTWRI